MTLVPTLMALVISESVRSMAVVRAEAGETVIAPVPATSKLLKSMMAVVPVMVLAPTLKALVIKALPR